MNKIDFEKIEEIASSDDTLVQYKKDARNGILGSIATFSVCWLLLITETIDKNNDFLFFLVFLIIIISIIRFFANIFSFFGAKNKSKTKKQHNLYKAELPFLTLIPNNINFEEIRLLNADGKDRNDVESQLATQAFSYKADAIIKYKYNSETISTTRSSGRRVNTSHKTKHRGQGVAIRLLD